LEYSTYCSVFVYIYDQRDFIFFSIVGTSLILSLTYLILSCLLEQLIYHNVLIYVALGYSLPVIARVLLWSKLSFSTESNLCLFEVQHPTVVHFVFYIIIHFHFTVSSQLWNFHVVEHVCGSCNTLAYLLVSLL
jgi:hypothetical protein